MGYTTDFDGLIKLDKPLTKEHQEFLHKFNDDRHEGKEYPGYWCQWVPACDEDTVIEWDYGEKFYEYVEWMEYIIDNFLKPWGYIANGNIEWFGEDRNDLGMIVVEDNKVSTRSGTITYN